jgi:hypothetical protein
MATNVKVKEYARMEGVLARFGVDLELASDLSCGIRVSKMAECCEKVHCTFGTPGGNGTGTDLMHTDMG